jgi:hypothetical protein
MLDFLRAPPRRFVYLPVRLQRHELLSLTSAAGFELSRHLVQRAGRPPKNCAGWRNLERASKVQPDAVTETGPRRHRRRHARLLSFSYVARHRNPTGYGSSNQLFT